MTASASASALAPLAPVRLPAVAPVAITGAGVVSPAGAGLAALAALLERGAGGHDGPPAGDDGAFPPIGVRSVDGVSPADHVGRKGTRRLDRMVGFGLVATHLALGSAGRGGPADGDPLREQTAVAVGTSTGSIRSVWELAHSTYPGGPAYVPSRFPNSVMNSCAGQLAVWNGFKAVNATLASGHASSASAFRYARNALRSGQARSVLAGGVEELCPHLAWGWHASGTLEPDAVLGEGAAMLVLEAMDAGDRVSGDGPVVRPVLAELLAAEVAHAGGRSPASKPAGLAATLARCVARALARSGVAPDDVDLLAPGAATQRGVAAAEEEGVRRALGREVPAVVRVSDVVGDCYSAAGAMQAAAVLARWSGGAHPGERYALVTSAGGDGNAGCLLLRRPGAS